MGPLIEASDIDCLTKAAKLPLADGADRDRIARLVSLAFWLGGYADLMAARPSGQDHRSHMREIFELTSRLADLIPPEIIFENTRILPIEQQLLISGSIEHDARAGIPKGSPNSTWARLKNLHEVLQALLSASKFATELPISFLREPSKIGDKRGRKQDFGKRKLFELLAEAFSVTFGKPVLEGRRKRKPSQESLRWAEAVIRMVNERIGGRVLLNLPEEKRETLAPQVPAVVLAGEVAALTRETMGEWLADGWIDYEIRMAAADLEAEAEHRRQPQLSKLAAEIADQVHNFDTL